MVFVQLLIVGVTFVSNKTNDLLLCAARFVCVCVCVFVLFSLQLLHCITKLFGLPITVNHLQDTGIGRTVNTLRKDDGEVGMAAKALVAKWKALVAAEKSSDEEDNNDKDAEQPNNNEGD